MLILDERHQVHVVLAPDDEDALAGVTLGVRVLQDVEQVASLDVEDESSNPMPRSALSFAFFASSQSKYFTARQKSTMCAHGTRWRRLSVPTSAPKRGPRTIIRQPTPTKNPIKNGPEIVNFRPVLGFPAALANRRLQPLGHLTVSKLLRNLRVSLQLLSC